MKTRAQHSLGGVFLVAVSAVSFGLMPIFAKVAYAAGISTHTLLFLRFSVAAVLMFALFFARRLPMPSKKEILAFLLLGGIGYVGQSFCYCLALNYASSSLVSLLLYTYPALVMLGAALAFHERITAKKLISLVLALAGAFLVIWSEFEASLPGILLAVGAALFYTVYILISSRVVRADMGVQSSAFIMLGAALVFGGMNLFLGFTPPAQPSGILAALLIALVSTVLAIWCFFTGMARTGPTVASLVSTLEPVVTVLASAVLLSEPVTLSIVLGGVLVLASLLVTARPGGMPEG